MIDNEKVVGTIDGRSGNCWSHNKLARKMGGARQHRLVEFKVSEVVLFFVNFQRLHVYLLNM